MRRLLLLGGFLASISFPANSQEWQEVIPTEQEFDFMQEFDQHVQSDQFTDHFDGSSSDLSDLDSRVYEDQNGQRKIHWDYGNSPGMTIYGTQSGKTLE